MPILPSETRPVRKRRSRARELSFTSACMTIAMPMMRLPLALIEPIMMLDDALLALWCAYF